MVKDIVYICLFCVVSFSKWLGCCENCGEWNIIIEEKVYVFGFGKVVIKGKCGSKLMLIDLVS